MIRAAIDLGTVTSRLMVGETQGRRVDVLERAICITDLGEGLTETGVISDEAYARLLGALLEFKEVITNCKTRLFCAGREVGEIPLKAVATSAMRDAANAKEVLTELSEYGFEIEIISGTREAELSFKGTLSGFSELPSSVLSIDVGGGSTEIILGTHDAAITASHSFDIGSRRITELFLQSDPPKREELEKAREWIREQSVEFFASLPALPEEVLAVAGTATSAITMRDAIEEYDSTLVHGRRILDEELQTLIESLASLPLEERKLVTGLHPKRAYVIVGGLVILQEMLQATKKNSLLVSDTDILQGILLDKATF